MLRQAITSLVLALAAAAASAAAPPPMYLQFSPNATKGALYRPDAAKYPKPHIGVVVIHRNSNFLSHISTRELSARGFVVLAMNPRCDNNESLCAPWEDNALDVKQGVQYLRKEPGITKVVLLGHSGGGPTMSFYQAVAEHGTAFCQRPEKLIKCSNALANLPVADGMILMDSHPGNGINAVRALNAAVTNDDAVMNRHEEPKLDASLDALTADNGFNPNGPSRYSEDFKRRFFKAASDRMNRLIANALTRLERIEREKLGDEPFVIPLALGTDLRDADMSIHHATQKPRKLLRNDGTIEADKPVEMVRVPNVTREGARGFPATRMLTVKSFLSVRAVRSTDALDGIEWCSSNNSTGCNLQQVSIPVLVTAMGGGEFSFVRDSEVFFDMAASRDKDFVVIDGATHGGTPCKPCEKTPGQYGNATRNMFDLMQRWMAERF